MNKRLRKKMMKKRNEMLRWEFVRAFSVNSKGELFYTINIDEIAPTPRFIWTPAPGDVKGHVMPINL